MFLVDIVDSRSHMGDEEISRRREMVDVMREFADLLKTVFPEATSLSDEMLWDRDQWTETLLTEGFLVQGDAYAIVLENKHAPEKDRLVHAFKSICEEHAMPFSFHAGFARFDSLNRLDADDNTLTVNHCFALLEQEVKEDGSTII